MLGTNTAPDVFFLKGMISPSYMSFGILRDLSDDIAKDPSFDSDDFYPACSKLFKKMEDNMVFRKTSHLTFFSITKSCLLKQALDSLPTNWAELEAAAQALTKDIDGDGNTDQFGLVIEPVMEMIMPFVYQNGGYFQILMVV